MMIATHVQPYMEFYSLVSVTADSCSLIDTRESAQHQTVGGVHDARQNVQNIPSA